MWQHQRLEMNNTLTQAELRLHFRHLYDLPDKAIMTPTETAFLLGVSEKKLSRLRSAGGGPPYLQYAETGSEARNQAVLYRFGDVIAYQDNSLVTSTMDAAIQRGLAFITMADIDEQPFFIEISTGNVISHGYDMGPDDLYDVHPSTYYELVFMDWADALSKTWRDKEKLAIYTDKHNTLLNKNNS